MTPEGFAELMKLGGPYVVIFVLLGVIARLWTLLQSAQAALLADKDKQIEEGEATFAAVSAALQTVNKMLEALPTIQRARR